jgi:hypothetical protein
MLDVSRSGTQVIRPDPFGRRAAHMDQAQLACTEFHLAPGASDSHASWRCCQRGSPVMSGSARDEDPATSAQRWRRPPMWSGGLLGLSSECQSGPGVALPEAPELIARRGLSRSALRALPPISARHIGDQNGPQNGVSCPQPSDFTCLGNWGAEQASQKRGAPGAGIRGSFRWRLRTSRRCPRGR